MKIYLDTNIIFGFFNKWILAKRKGTDFKEPEIIRFLKETKEIELFVSPLVKAEIGRRLRSEFSATESEANEVWTLFLETLMIKELETAQINDEIAEIAFKIPFRKRISNLMHLIICKQYDIWFLTGDKEILTKGKKFYNKIISYVELRKRFS